MNKEKYIRQEVLTSSLYHVREGEGIKLSQNECPWDLPLELKVQIMERLLKTDWNRYPINAVERMREKLAAFCGVEPGQLVMSNGSNTIVQALVNVVPRKARILVLDPSFVVYEIQVLLAGNKLVKVPLSEDFELLTEKTIAAIKKEKPGLIFIANPNAPTGTLFEKRSLHRILETADCPVVIDEAYYEFTKETVLNWMADFEHLIVMRTFSKAVAIAGMRFGFIIAHPALAAEAEKFLMTFRLPVSTCVIVEEILKQPQYIEGYVEQIVQERARVFSKMQKIANVRVYPSSANFLLFRVADAAAVAGSFLEQKIQVRNVSNEGALNHCLRVAIGTREENDAFLKALGRVAERA